MTVTVAVAAGATTALTDAACAHLAAAVVVVVAGLAPARPGLGGDDGGDGKRGGVAVAKTVAGEMAVVMVASMAEVVAAVVCTRTRCACECQYV